MTAPSPSRVLVVDDTEENLVAMDALLRTLEVEVVLARSGTEALEQLLVKDFALMLLDVNMPEMDGFQLAELVRAAPRTKHVPIIFVTAAYEPHRMAKGYEAGAVDFLFKPVDPTILLAKVRTFITLHDQQRQLAGQLAHIEAVTARLSESLRLHEMFVAALNHDLRTPLHTISLGVQMLDEQLPPELRTLTRRVGAATERMEQMIDQLYDVARTRLGEGIQVERSAIDLGQVVEAVVREAELRSGKHALRLEVRGDTRGSWDPSRISRVAANLIANAQTHGSAGTPIAVGVDGTDPAEVRLTVHNGGQIPPDVLPQVFEPFRRGTTGKAPGLGLGLYIVREITLAHGGRVSVTSTAQHGTQFEIWLPRAAVSSAA